MTTFQMPSASNLDSSATEDPMELTSDVDRRFGADDDIDIDLDLTADNYQYEEDEYMREDINVLTNLASTNEQDMQAGKDDEMADDTHVEGSMVARSSIYDEDLGDAEYVDLYPADEESIVGAHQEYPLDMAQESFDNIEPTPPSHDQNLTHDEQPKLSTESLGVILEEYTEEHRDMIAFHDTSGPVIGENLQELTELQEIKTSRHEFESLEGGPQSSQQGFNEEQFENQGEGHQAISHHFQQHDINSSRGETSDNEDEIHEYSNDAAYAPTNVPDISEPQEEVEYPVDEEPFTSQDNEDAQADEYSYNPDEASTREATHVHPVVVLYQDNEISLFPPVNQDGESSNTYFLQDEQAAGGSIKSLFGAFRSVLGESISDHDQLMLDIDELDLHISESTIESSTATLLEVIDIYRHLQHYDGLEVVPPLYMHLTAKINFSHRIEFLLNAIVEGKGISQLQPSEAVDEMKQPRAHNLADKAQQGDAPSDVGSPNGALDQISENVETQEHLNTQRRLPASTESLSNEDTATQDYAPPKSTDTVGKEIDDTEAHSEFKSTEEEQDNKKDEISQIQEEQASKGDCGSQDAQQVEHNPEQKNTEGLETNTETPNVAVPSYPGQTLAQKPGEAAVKEEFEEDTIEYEEEEELGHGTSTDSSTLQGDISRTNTRYDHTETGEQSVEAEAEAEVLIDPGNDLDTTVETEFLEHCTDEVEQDALGDGQDANARKQDLFDPSDDPVAPVPAQANSGLKSLANADHLSQDDEDEITYEDEENVEAVEEPAFTEPNIASSPESLKRARSLHEDDDPWIDDAQGAKRVRSS